jgi:hypothetical protein
MEREIIWMQLLLIGILSSLTSCTEKTDDSYYEKYVFMNNSNHEIVIDAYTKNDDDYLKNTYSISKDSSFVQEIEIMFGSKTGIVALSDSVEIFFDSIKHNWFLPNSESEYNFLDRNNYLMDKLSDNHVKYTYVFSDSDYNNADSLK